MSLQVRRLGHVTLTTPDLDRQTEYYTGVLGLVLTQRSPNQVILATKQGQEAIVLEKGHAAHCPRLAFQVSPRSDLDEIAAALDDHGIRHETRSNITPGVAKAIVFQDPKGTSIEIFSSYSYADDNGSDAGIMPFKLGHVAFVTSEFDRVVDFYAKVLGFRISDWRGDFFMFMRCGPDHHSVNFVKGETNALHHIAFEVRDWAEIQRACDYLAKKDIRLVLGPIRHIIGHNIAIYHKNPDGILIECFTELDQMKDEELGYFDPRPWHQDRPQRPRGWEPHILTNYWGPGRLTSHNE